MKRTLLTLTVVLILTLTVQGQNLFLFGDNSYPCTETYTLQSNSESNNLNIVFAKGGTIALLGVSLEITSMPYSIGNIIIYLNDGTVIKCEDRGNNDYVNDIISTLCSLTEEQLSKLKNSNINTIRYTLKSRIFEGSEKDYSASNKGKQTVDFPGIVSAFYSNFNSSYVESEVTATDQGNGGGDMGASYDLGGRRILSLFQPQYDSDKEGIVVVAVTVDRSGRVTDAMSGIKGSTTLDENLLRVSREAAIQTRFESKADAPIIQKGTITYKFSLK